MALTRSYKETIQAELKKDPVFRNALFAEAIDALAENEVPEALSMLRDIAVWRGISVCTAESPYT